jgi:Mn-containing catalase
MRRRGFLRRFKLSRITKLALTAACIAAISGGVCLSGESYSLKAVYVLLSGWLLFDLTSDILSELRG